MQKTRTKMKTSSFKIPEVKYFALLANVLQKYEEGKIRKNSLSHYLSYLADRGEEYRASQNKIKEQK